MEQFKNKAKSIIESKKERKGKGNYIYRQEEEKKRVEVFYLKN